MRDEGILKFYNLANISTNGHMPKEQLVDLEVQAFYANKTIGFQRLFAAKGQNYKLDKLVRVYNTQLPEAAKYVILEDGRQYRIEDIQVIADEDALELSLSRLEKYYEVADESP